jgi:hypothetical protein
MVYAIIAGLCCKLNICAFNNICSKLKLWPFNPATTHIPSRYPNLRFPNLNLFLK